MTLYIHQEVRTLVRMELLKENGEFSALVEDLLRRWLKERRVKVPSARKVTEGDKR